MLSRPDIGALLRKPEGPPLRNELTAPGMRIGLFGGSFDPPHEGHLHVARTARQRLNLDRVWWIVAPRNPLKSVEPAAAYERRLDQVRALADEPGFAVSDIERRLGSPYTIDLVTALRRTHPRVRFVLIMGADNLASLHRWRDWSGLIRKIPVAVVARPGDAIRARLSPAAQRFRDARVDPVNTKALLEMRPPAWLYLTARLNAASSTALRASARSK